MIYDWLRKFAHDRFYIPKFVRHVFFIIRYIYIRKHLQQNQINAAPLAPPSIVGALRSLKGAAGA